MMRKYLFTAFGIVLGFIVYSLLIKISSSLIILINVLSIVVVYFAVKHGEIHGAFTGMICGLIQDSFSIGVFGVAGISKTLLGYIAGLIARKIDVQAYTRNLVFCAILLASELLVWMLIYLFIFGSAVYTQHGLLFLQPLCSSLFASFLFPLTSKLKLKFNRYRR